MVRCSRSATGTEYRSARNLRTRSVRTHHSRGSSYEVITSVVFAQIESRLDGFSVLFVGRKANDLALGCSIDRGVLGVNGSGVIGNVHGNLPLP